MMDENSVFAVVRSFRVSTPCTTTQCQSTGDVKSRGFGEKKKKRKGNFTYIKDL